MRTMTLGLLAVATLGAGLVSGCSDYGDGGMAPRYRNYSRYDYNRPDPQYNGYYADHYYRDSPRYRERRLSRNDRVYRGQDGRYYCRRSDGTTGLLVGAAIGGLLGNIIAPGDSKTFGTLLGGVAGGAAGASIDANNTRCR